MNYESLTFVLGPCAIESRHHALLMASELRAMARRLDCDFIYKSSFDKANRSRGDAARGVGIEEGLDILADVRRSLGIKVVTDVHLPQDVERVTAAVDVLQVPAFLCRQTDLLVECGRTGKPVIIKKGQFMSPGQMGDAAEKVAKAGGQPILCERGTSFGYGDLIVDPRSFPIMKSLGFPVILDATHACQTPSAGGTGGRREFIEPIARAGVVQGIAGVFMETHDCPAKAISDADTQYPLCDLESLLRRLLALDAAVKYLG